MRTQPTRNRFARHRLLAASLFFLLTLVSSVSAQDPPQKAGLVVQFGDGSLFTACVDLGADGQATGEEVLRASGLYAVIDYTSGFGGGTVCKINDQGCDFPGEACFCQCTMKPGTDCIYWTYFHRRDGQWRYATEGVSVHIVRAGDVEGWVWGPGTTSSGAQPPAITFEQVCGDAVAAPPPTVSPAQPTATLTPPPPTWTPTASPTTTAPRQTSPRPTNTPRPSPSGSPTPTKTAIASPTVHTATATATEPGPTPTRTDRPTITPFVPDRTAAGRDAGDYVIFGVLAVALIGVLIVMRVRQGS